MTEHARDLWDRAMKALAAARRELDPDPDLAASRAYYAAFYAVSALFALEGRAFSRHAAVEAAVHRDLVKAGRWPNELGAAYSTLVALRETADYGGGEHATRDDARSAVDAAARILDAVRLAHPEIGAGGPPA